MRQIIYLSIIPLCFCSFVFLSYYCECKNDRGSSYRPEDTCCNFKNILALSLKSKYGKIVWYIGLPVLLFELIYIFFYFQLGLPASHDQTEQALFLSAADWLSFLGSFLGFAGSLIMAYIVYKQNEKINYLTQSEYDTSASLTLIHTSCSKGYREFHIDNLDQYIPEKPNEFYYSIRCQTDNDTACEECSILVFVEIENNSKSIMRNISFESIVFSPVDPKCKTEIVYKIPGEKNWDPANGLMSIAPGRSIKRCFILEKIPKRINLSWMTFHFIHNENKYFDPKLLAYKEEGKKLYLLN